MKKILGAIIGIAIVVILAVFAFRGKDAQEKDLSQLPGGIDVSALQGPKATDEALYEVTLKTTQRSASQEGTVVELKGVLAQTKQGDLDFISEWRDIKDLTIMNQKPDTPIVSMALKKPMITSVSQGNVQHFLPKDFPPGLLTIQLSLLNKLFVPVTEASGNPVLRTEKDEAGTAKIQYDFTLEGQNHKVLKTWDRYVQDAIKIDAQDNVLRYVLTAERRLITLDGLLTTHFREPSSVHFTTAITVKYLKSNPTVSLAAQKAALEQTDLQKAAALAEEMARNKSGMTYEEALKKLESIDEKSDAQSVYEVFSAMKADVIQNPQHADTLIEKILATKARDEGSQRRIAVMFGALAQSQAPEISEKLGKLASDCPDTFCKLQAMVGLNDHPNPTETSANQMLTVARSTTDDQIAGTALLAAGAVAKKLPENDAAIAQELSKTLADPGKQELKNTVLAAMGNHGSADYFTPLTQNLNSTDINTRAAATYSMRYLPNAEVNATLLDIMRKDQSLDVKREAVKAMAFRNLSSDEYVTVARQAISSPDRDLQQDAARVLVNAWKDNPKTAQAAVDAMKSGQTNAEVKKFIEAETKPVETAGSPPPVAPASQGE